MAEDTPTTQSRGGKRCVAWGCNKTYKNGDVSLHSFPFDRPEILRQWTNFVRTSRKNWNGPSKYSVLCSDHFDADAYPAKYRIMETVGQIVHAKTLNKDAVPTKPSKNQPQQENGDVETDTSCKRPADSQGTPRVMKIARRGGYHKREALRILSEFDQRLNSVQCLDAEETQPADEDIQSEVLEVSVLEETNVEETSEKTVSVGTQLSMIKPAHKSHSTQTKYQVKDQVVQVGTSVRMKDIAVSCNLLHAPPLVRLGQEKVPAHSSSFEPTVYSDDTITDEEEEDDVDGEYSVGDSYNSDDSDESGEGNQHPGKFLVYETELLDLFSSCPSCTSPTLGEIDHCRGTFITVFQECGVCGYQRTWRSQPMIGAIPAGNFELSCAILFSGSLPSKSIRMFKFLNMAAISIRTFMYHQQYYLHPAILQVWKNHQGAYIEEVQDTGRAVRLGGDGRADTPGHCAMFGSYTLMDLEENKVVDMQLVQSNKVRSSCHMEKEGLVRAVRYFEDNGVAISHLITDRHLQVAKWVRENMPETTHYIDVLHVAKGLKKKLVALSKEKDCEVLEDWIRSITNHLYWVPSATPEGEDEDIRWEKWLSVFRHVQNIHVGHGDHFRQCEHGELDTDDRQKRWLRPGSKVVEKLEGIIHSRQMKKDIRMLSPQLQTANLEAYHSLINHFAPKMNKFSYQGMQSRLLLAALHFNENGSREQASTKTNQLRYKITFPKQKKGDFTVKKIKTPSTYGYVDSLLDEVTSRVRVGEMPHHEDVEDVPPPLCHQFIHPEKDVAVHSLLTRFTRN